MRLKTFHANTMTEAMQMIRDAMGDDAVIVATGENPGRGGVRVTAAMEPPAFEIGDDGVAAPSNWLQYDNEQDTDTITEELTEVLLRHCVPEDIMDHMISCATVMGYDDLGIALSSTLEELFTFRPLPTRNYNKPIMMVGPPGSGKTLAAAKLAARSTLMGMNIGVISTDTIRAGGVEQLQAFTNLLKINLQKCDDPISLRSITEELLPHKDQIIIDTSGLNPFDKNDVKILAKLIGCIDCRPALVLPAGIDAEEAGEMARVFATIGASEIIATRVDIARRLGNLLAAAHQGSLSFSDFSDTPKVAQGLNALSPRGLAELLVPRLNRGEKNTNRSRHEHDKMTTTKTGTQI